MNEKDSKAGHVAVGHPVDIASGSVFTLMDDFVLSGTIPLAWSRFYSNDIDSTGWLGRGWVSPWFMSLNRVAEGYLLIDEHGGPLIFPLPQEVDLAVGGRVISLGGNMELVRHENYFAVVHWHYGTDDVKSFCFKIIGDGKLPLAWLENIHGHRILVHQDELGRPVRLIQEIEERVLELTYELGPLLSEVWLMGEKGVRKRLASYEYDKANRLIAALDAMGHRTSYGYDANHRMIRETNALGASFNFSYDAKGRCIHAYGDGGYIERKLKYSVAPRATRVTDSLGNITTYVLNSSGQVIQEVSPLGATTTTEYDEFGRPVFVRDPLGGVLRYEYDMNGNRSAIVHEDGGRSKMTYNANHSLLTYTSTSGAMWAYTFDARGGVIGLRNPSGEQYSAVRDNRGLVTETRFPTGRVVKRRYGSRLRWVEAHDEISLLTRTEYDESGNQIKIFDPEGLVQRISYDLLGCPIEAEDRIGRTYRFTWNALGELTGQSGHDVAWERRKYDGFGQLVEHTNPLGVLRIRYDTEGRITQVINRANEILTWIYDADGWLVTETGFDGCTEQFEYDLCGRPTRFTKADGRWISQTFSVSGGVVRRESSEGEIVAFVYDAEGRLIKTHNSVAEVILERNQAGQVIAEVQNGRRIEYVHDSDGDRIGRRITGIDGVELRFKRDVRKRLIALEDNSGVCIDLQWDEVNRLIERRFGRNVTERFIYDNVGRIREQSVSSLERGTQIVRRFEYDSADNLVARQDWQHGRSVFTYDEIGRLLNVRAGGGIVENYSYDANGAILETQRGRRVLAIGGRTLEEGARRYTYSRDGSLQTISSAGSVTVFEHNIDGQITKAILPDEKEARYEYDPLGRRVAKDVGGIRTEFLWDGPVLAAERQHGGPTESYYLFGFEPLVQWQEKKRIFPVTDQSGIVREVLDERGSLLWYGSFEAYGAPVTQSGPPKTPFRLRGQYCDNETELYYNLNRSYSPILGDYTSRDPIGIQGGTHFYAYPRNPLQWDDPFGLKCGTAACGEKSMDGFFGQKGYKKISARGKNPHANGIDAIYHNPNGKPPYIIAEAKNRGGYLHPDQHGNEQMSNAWINSAPGNADPSKSRLERALPPGSPHLDAIEAGAKKGDVGTAVYNPTKNPKVTNSGLYGGSNATDQAAPPKGSGPW